MKAMVIEEYNKDMVYRDYPDPKIQDSDEVIIKVKACGVCATDLKVLSGHTPSEGLPRIAGHEVMGEVVEIGFNVTNVKPGDRVVSSTYLACGTCKHCREGRETLCEHLSGRLGISVDGGFAQLMRIKARNLAKVPDGVKDEEAAILPCGAGVPYHSLVKRIRISPVDRIVIIGTGGVGLQAVQIAKLCGAQVVGVDIDDEKLKLAKKYGADYLVNSTQPNFVEKLKEIGNLTVLFDTSGYNSVIQSCASTLEKGAKLLLIGYGPGKNFNMILEDIVRREYDIIGSNGVSIEDLGDLMGLLADKKICPIVQTHPLTELNEICKKIEANEVIGRMVMIPED